MIICVYVKYCCFEYVYIYMSYIVVYPIKYLIRCHLLTVVK